MEDDHRRDIALFRYSLIREAADPALSPQQRTVGYDGSQSPDRSCRRGTAGWTAGGSVCAGTVSAGAVGGGAVAGGTVVVVGGREGQGAISCPWH